MYYSVTNGYIGADKSKSQQGDETNNGMLSHGYVYQGEPNAGFEYNGTVYKTGDSLQLDYTGAGQGPITIIGSPTIRFTCYGAEGGNADNQTKSQGGMAVGDFQPPTGTQIYCYVGSEGTQATHGGSTHSSNFYLNGGWNGGGGVYQSAASTASGGGATDFRVASSLHTPTLTKYRYTFTTIEYSTRFIVAGGGCGTNCCWQQAVGNGGGLSGTGTGPGTQTGSGTGGQYDSPGFGYGATSQGSSGGSAGGGGGWWGGRGTGRGNWGSSSGGGSGWIYKTTNQTGEPTNYNLYVPTSMQCVANDSFVTGGGSLISTANGRAFVQVL